MLRSLIRFIALMFLCCVAMRSHAGDSLVMHKLLQRINQLQVKEEGVFPKGLFPSYRIYALNKDRQKADINIFFTGLISFTLRNIMPELTARQQLLAHRIITNSLPVAAKFRNRKGRPTYDFWPTDTPRIFPHSGWMNRFDKSQSLPDDMDDTAVMLLALAANDSIVKVVHAIMQEFTNSPNKQVKNSFKAYRHIGAYSTWFGKKMPVDFDVCVLANILYMVQRYDLPWSKADSASISLLAKVIGEKKHLTAAAYVSPHYSRTPLILYHVSRLMSVKPIPELEAYKTQLVAETEKALRHADHFMDQVILSSALLRWGVKPPALPAKEVESMQTLIEDEQFSFFIANMASILPGPLKGWIGGAGVGKFYYYCPAYNNLLVLEYLTLCRRMALTSR